MVEVFSKLIFLLQRCSYILFKGCIVFHLLWTPIYCYISAVKNWVFIHRCWVSVPSCKTDFCLLFLSTNLKKFAQMGPRIGDSTGQKRAVSGTPGRHNWSAYMQIHLVGRPKTWRCPLIIRDVKILATRKYFRELPTLKELINAFFRMEVPGNLLLTLKNEPIHLFDKANINLIHFWAQNFRQH
jgi:hypothetical protein